MSDEKPASKPAKSAAKRVDVHGKLEVAEVHELTAREQLMRQWPQHDWERRG